MKKIIKTNLILFLFLMLAQIGFAQSINEMIKKLPTKTISILQSTSSDCVFKTREDKSIYILAGSPQKITGVNNSILNVAPINVRTGQLSQGATVYINGIRVTQSFTPQELVDDVELFFHHTPAIFEGPVLSLDQQLQLIY